MEIKVLEISVYAQSRPNDVEERKYKYFLKVENMRTITVSLFIDF